MYERFSDLGRYDKRSMTQMKLTGVSHNIGKDAQMRDQFVSRLGLGDIASLYAGREIDEGWCIRQQAAEKDEILKTLQI
jgi:hypothetical protein